MAIDDRFHGLLLIAREGSFRSVLSLETGCNFEESVMDSRIVLFSAKSADSLKTSFFNDYGLGDRCNAGAARFE